MDRARYLVTPRTPAWPGDEGPSPGGCLGAVQPESLGMTDSLAVTSTGRAWRIMARRLRTWLLALALAAPLVAITAWVIHGATDPRARQPASTGLAGVVARPAPAPRRPALRAARGARGRRGRRLRADGCRRLVAWRFERPPADAEALFFRSADGARAVLEREAGPGRTPGPGDEAQVSEQAVYFRRGAVLVRVFLDPGASPPPGELVARAAGDRPRAARRAV